MNNRIAFYTIGCRLNQSETASLRNSFAENGYRIVDSHQTADIAIINTCTVTNNGDADTRKLINKIIRTSPACKIALIGCQAQTQAHELAVLPSVALVVGNAQKMVLVDIVRTLDASRVARVMAPPIPRGHFTMPAAAVERNRTRANLKIQDGCDFYCSFCEIPYARGHARSRVFDDSIREARVLAEAGHREIVLTGINVGMYCHDGKTIVDVVGALEAIEGVARIRISSIEPTTAPAALLERMGTTKLCRHLHMPLQSGSDEILSLMNRKYRSAHYAQFICEAQRRVPGICIGADVMVGFPGESDAHFEETLRFVGEVPLSYLHVFSYCDRRNNASKNFAGKVPHYVAAQRSERLRALSAQKRRAFMRAAVGTVSRVLFEDKKKSGWIGLTDTYIRVNVESNRNLHNCLMPVTLTGVGTAGMSAVLAE